MSADGKPLPAIDPVLYAENRHRMPDAVLVPYAGRWVAISADCTQVLASGPDLATAEANLAALGVPGNAVGWERVPGLDEETWL